VNWQTSRARPVGDLRRVNPRIGRGGPDLYVVTVGLIGLAVLWLRPLASSLWLDETGTFWIIRGSLAEVFHRALEFHGQSPLYPLVLWVWTRLFGTGEIALRLPSIIGAGAAAWFCHRIGLRLAGRTEALLATCIFVLLPPVAFAAGDARPYALALAALLGTTLAMLRWLETEEPLAAVGTVVLAALTLYLHYLFALALIPHALFAGRALKRKGRSAVPVLSAAIGGLALLLAPSVPHFIGVIGRRQASSLFTYGTVPDLLAWFAPPAIVVAYLVGRFARITGEDLGGESRAIGPGIQAFLVIWLVLPPTALFLAGAISGVGLFAERHYLSSVPAVALLSGSAFALLSLRRRRIAIVVLGILVVLMRPGPQHTPWVSDWRGAADAVNALSGSGDTLLLVYTGFSESREMGWVLDERRSEALLAPLAAYPMDGRAHPLPFYLTEDAARYLERILVDDGAAAERIVLVSTEITKTYDVWLAERTSTLGYSQRSLGDFGDIRVVVFERDGP
jgi:hypothetical protein